MVRYGISPSAHSDDASALTATRRHERSRELGRAASRATPQISKDAGRHGGVPWRTPASPGGSGSESTDPPDLFTTIFFSLFSFLARLMGLLDALLNALPVRPSPAPLRGAAHFPPTPMRPATHGAPLDLFQDTAVTATAAAVEPSRAGSHRAHVAPANASAETDTAAASDTAGAAVDCRGATRRTSLLRPPMPQQRERDPSAAASASSDQWRGLAAFAHDELLGPVESPCLLPGQRPRVSATQSFSSRTPAVTPFISALPRRSVGHERNGSVSCPIADSPTSSDAASKQGSSRTVQQASVSATRFRMPSVNASTGGGRSHNKRSAQSQPENGDIACNGSATNGRSLDQGAAAEAGASERSNRWSVLEASEARPSASHEPAPGSDSEDASRPASGPGPSSRGPVAAATSTAGGPAASAKSASSLGVASWTRPLAGGHDSDTDSDSDAAGPVERGDEASSAFQGSAAGARGAQFRPSGTSVKPGDEMSIARLLRDTPPKPPDQLRAFETEEALIRIRKEYVPSTKAGSLAAQLLRDAEKASPVGDKWHAWDDVLRREEEAYNATQARLKGEREQRLRSLLAVGTGQLEEYQKEREKEEARRAADAAKAAKAAAEAEAKRKAEADAAAAAKARADAAAAAKAKVDSASTPQAAPALDAAAAGASGASQPGTSAPKGAAASEKTPSSAPEGAAASAGSMLRCAASAQAAAKKEVEIVAALCGEPLKAWRADDTAKPLPQRVTHKIKKELNKAFNSLGANMADVRAKSAALVATMASVRGVHPHAATHAARELTDKLVAQAVGQVALQPKYAFVLGQVGATVAREAPGLGPDGSTSMRDFLLGLLKQRRCCPLCVPQYHAQTSGNTKTPWAEWARANGYQEEGDGQLQSEDEFLNRTKGVVRFYAAFLLSLNEPETAWRYVASLLNAVPANRVTATALESFLAVAGYGLAARYGTQFLKLLALVQGSWLAELERVDTGAGAVAARLRMYCESGYRKVPEGWVLPEDVDETYEEKDTGGGYGGGHRSYQGGGYGGGHRGRRY